MANGVRVLLRPIIQKWPKGELVSGVTIGLEIFGKGPGLNKGEVKPAKLILHGAFLKKARDEKKDKPKFEKFATISGKIRLSGGKPVFELEPTGKIDYDKPEPTKPTFRRIDVKYEAPAFSGAPSLPVLKPDEAPPEPHALLRLRLPEEPKDMRFAIVGAELEIGGASSSAVTDNDLLDVPLPPIQLMIIKVDHHFAPSKENLEIKYKIGGLLGARVLLEVTSKHYAAGPILKRALTAAELTDGLHTLTWDGKSNAASGDLKGRFLNPLFGPYDVKLTDGSKHEAKGTFAVLYHSLELELGDWTPDAKAPDKATKKKDWVQYRLNELGYFAGPVGHDFDNYLKKAVIRYKANHKKMHELIVSNYNDTITADLETALTAGDNRRTFLDGDALKDPKKNSRVLLEALTYENKTVGNEFSESKATHEQARLNRPLLPIQANIFLMGKAKTKVLAPEAVGKARVNWRFTDVPEDLTKQFASTPSQPTKTRAYIEKALKLKGGRTGSNGDNCHKDFGGIRDAAATNWETPFLVGTAYEPFELKKDAGQSVCFSEAHNDPAKHKNRLGQTGCYFRPSIIAGDAYSLTAEIDFTGLPNAAALEKLHNVAKPIQRPHVKTGAFQIWHNAKVAAVLTWPGRTIPRELPQIRAEFEKAYIDLDTSTIDIQPIGSFLTEPEYKTLVAANTPNLAANVKLFPDALLGVTLPAQSANETAATYITRIKAFMLDYHRKVRADLARQISKNLRKKHPVGFVFTEFLMHKPVSVPNKPPTDMTITPARTNVVYGIVSVGMADSVILADLKDPDHVYYVMAHEMGHNFWLKHWENAGGVAADHDTNDHNCMMSYPASAPFPHQAPTIYSPHFCGQCILKLRGWDIDNALIPAHS